MDNVGYTTGGRGVEVVNDNNQITPLQGYDEDDLEWIVYRGPREKSFDILIGRSKNSPSKYHILGAGHYLQIHKSHRAFFRQLEFTLNQPDPRKGEDTQAVSTEDFQHVYWCKCFDKSEIFYYDIIKCQNCDKPIYCRFCESYWFASRIVEGFTICDKDDCYDQAITESNKWE